MTRVILTQIQVLQHLPAVYQPCLPLTTCNLCFPHG